MDILIGILFFILVVSIPSFVQTGLTESQAEVKGKRQNVRAKFKTRKLNTIKSFLNSRELFF